MRWVRGCVGLHSVVRRIGMLGIQQNGIKASSIRNNGIQQKGTYHSGIVGGKGFGFHIDLSDALIPIEFQCLWPFNVVKFSWGRKTSSSGTSARVQI